tara:strand:+ start:627 stop:806 length:180 start_codon:yes stop_codon:yes gene_type:complete
MKFKFEKFIEDICQKEKSFKERQERPLKEDIVTPQRKYNQLYRERWQNRITFRRKNESN